MKERDLKRIIKLTVCIILVFFIEKVKSQNAGDTDITFGGTGFVVTSIGISYSWGYSMIIQSDGKIIVAGSSMLNGHAAVTLVRYMTNGSLDNSFGNNGIAVIQTGQASGANSIALQSDNKIVAAGFTQMNDSINNFTAIRYNTDGTLDNSFGNGGIVLVNVENSSHAYNIAIKSNGKIVISGYSNYNFNTGVSLAQLNSNGSLDTSFGVGGISIHHFTESPDVEAWAMALDSDDNIITTGMIYDVDLLRSKIAIIRFNAEGNLDMSFGDAGVVRTSIESNSDDFGNAVVIQSDNKPVIAGTSNNRAVIARYNINGTPDTTFGTGGIVLTNFTDIEAAEAYGITVQNDGKIIAAGVSGTNASNANGNFGLVRFNTDGTFDNTFGINGKVFTDISNGQNDVAFSVKEHSDGKLVVSGISKNGSFYNFAVARYNGTSVLLPEYLINESVKIFPNPAFDKIEISGINNDIIEIVNVQGQIIKTFSSSNTKLVIDISTLSDGVYIMKIKTDNRIIVKKFNKQ